MPATTTVTTVPNTPPSPPPTDAPPAYTPYTLPPYTHFDPDSDRRNYAIALLMHNLRMNGLPTAALEDLDIERIRAIQEDPDRVQRRAMRDHRASQDESQWGTRRGHGHGRARARAGPSESEDGQGGWLAWFFGLFGAGLQGTQDEERMRLLYSSGIPMFIAPNGSI